MILTVTMNPSIDIAYQLDRFQLDTVNRVIETHKTPGGKGLNVTRVLNQLGDKILATGLIGGKIGEYLEEGLDKLDIKHAFTKISGETRNCIAILHDGKQTEILEKGPIISSTEASLFLEDLLYLIPKLELVVISGSLPQGLPSDYYAKMISMCNDHNLPVILDSSGESLEKTLLSTEKPTVIKPNTEELSQLLNREITDDSACLKSALSNPLFEGIEWVIVSLGAKGAFAKHYDKFYQVNIPKIEVVNPVGSGDSTVAGIASAYACGVSDIELLKKGNVLGMLNAQEKETGKVNLENYNNLFNKIEVIEV